jgi:DNA-binding MarR family transcriptional regulator
MAHDMQSQLKQGKPFDHPEEELFLSLVCTVDILGRKISDFLKEQGLSGAQYNVLRILRGSGPEGLPCGEISTRMVTRDPDVTRLLDRLEQRKLVTRARNSEDRRVISTRITPDGMALLQTLDEPVVKIHEEQFSFLSSGEIRELLSHLTRIREKMGSQGCASSAELAGLVGLANSATVGAP